MWRSRKKLYFRLTHERSSPAVNAAVPRYGSRGSDWSRGSTEDPLSLDV